MKYKMVVMDIDDTLIKDDKTISTAVKNAIEKAQTMWYREECVLARGSS
jgi:hydroxymethylpyrimidine pyrophosphatase-like HAD family hydrolase